jgi:hypothetical protein
MLSGMVRNSPSNSKQICCREGSRLSARPGGRREKAIVPRCGGCGTHRVGRISANWSDFTRSYTALGTDGQYITVIPLTSARRRAGTYPLSNIKPFCKCRWTRTATVDAGDARSFPDWSLSEELRGDGRCNTIDDNPIGKMIRRPSRRPALVEWSVEC